MEQDAPPQFCPVAHTHVTLANDVPDLGRKSSRYAPQTTIASRNSIGRDFSKIETTLGVKFEARGATEVEADGVAGAAGAARSLGAPWSANAVKLFAIVRYSPLSPLHTFCFPSSCLSLLFSTVSDPLYPLPWSTLESSTVIRSLCRPLQRALRA